MISEAEKSRLQVGRKQVLRALAQQNAQRVYLAADCEAHIKAPVEEAAEKAGCPVLYVESMKELGKLCGIHVKASCAVIAKN